MLPTAHRHSIGQIMPSSPSSYRRQSNNSFVYIVKVRSFSYKLVRLLPLILIYAILFFAFYSYFLSLVLSHLYLDQRDTRKAAAYGLIFLILWTGSIGNLALAAFVPAGKIDEDNAQDESAGQDAPFLASQMDQRDENIEDGPRKRNRVETKRNGQARFCRKCRLPKPDRSHHCSSCQRCILKLDHHCPWLGGGCVGHHNYKFFLLLLLYAGGLCSFVAVTTVLELLIFSAGGPANFWLIPTKWVVVLLLGAILSIPVGGFGLYHLYLTATNWTTVESMERVPSYAHHLSQSTDAYPSRRNGPQLSRATRRRIEREVGAINIYDLGVWRNLKAVLGQSGWLWPIPTRVESDGRSFPTNLEAERELERLLAQLRAGTERQYDSMDRDAWSTRRDELAADRSSEVSNQLQQRLDHPFTYGNNSLNPQLRSSSSTIRQRRNTAAGDVPKTSKVSPYHPDYANSSSDDRSDDDARKSKKAYSDNDGFARDLNASIHDNDDDDDVPLGMSMAVRRALMADNPELLLPELDTEDPITAVVRVRRGSEGYEVRPTNVDGSRRIETDAFDSDQSWDRLDTGEDDDGDGDEDDGIGYDQQERQDLYAEDGVNEYGDRIRRRDANGDRYRRYVSQVSESDSDSFDGQ